MWVSLLVWVRKGRLGCGETVDDGCCSCDDADCSAEGGSSTSKCGAVGRQRISVMLRCFRIGFVYDPFAYAWAEVAGMEAATLGRGSQSEPGCNGPYSQVTSESLSLEWYKRRVKSSQQLRVGNDKKKGGGTDQLRVSGLIVLSLFLCFHQVLQLAFSRRLPLAMAFLFLVMFFHELHTSSSRHWCER